jgi:hypothetical protein
MMSNQYAYFNELPVGALFACNGNRYRKQSSRTAWLFSFNRIFYFAQLELCIVGRHSRLHEGYFEGGTDG